jgi:hypothetical protein
MEKIVSHIMREKKSIWKKVSCFKKDFKSTIADWRNFPNWKSYSLFLKYASVNNPSSHSCH